jgi:hypothetical protein
MKLWLMLLSVITLQQISGGGGGHDPIKRRQNWILVALAILGDCCCYILWIAPLNRC